jgi:tRNA-dihydrouridine synthase
LEHADLEKQYEGEEKATFHLRRIGAWYIAGRQNAAAWRAELGRSQTVDQIRAVLVRSLSPDGAPADAPAA